MSAPAVLMWHGFGDRTDADDPYRMFVGGEAFAHQLDLLLERDHCFLNLDRYLHGLHTKRWPARSVLITMDDGYVSSLTVAAPLLAARGIPAVLFALPGRLGGLSDWMPKMPNERLLDVKGLIELEQHGIQVECHGWDHRLLPGLPQQDLRRQVVDARDALADVLQRQPVAFAYPSGRHDEASRRAVEEAGFFCGFSVHSASHGRWALPRRDVNPTDNMLTYRLKATPLWHAAYHSVGRVGPIRRALHRIMGSSRLR